MSLEAILARLDHRDYAAGFTWITAQGGDVTLVVSGRRNSPLDHRGCAAMFTWITAVRRNVRVDHSGKAAKLR